MLAHTPAPTLALIPRRATSLRRVHCRRTRAAFLHHLPLLTALIISASGCSAFFRERRPDAGERFAARAWHIRCAWVVALREQRGDAPIAGTPGWEWATDADGRRLVVRGGLEDGFLRVDEISAVADRDQPGGVAVEASIRTVTDLCAASVRRAHPNSVPTLYGFSAVRDGEEVEVPMTFATERNGPPITRLVVFGDSLSDSGNLQRRLKVMPGSPYWLGRFSDGPNWVDWLAWNNGLAVQNHAVGGAVAVTHEDEPTANVFATVERNGQLLASGSVDRAVDDYIAYDLTRRGVQRPWDTAYVLWAGANDYLTIEPFTGHMRTLVDTPRGEESSCRIIAETVAALTSQLWRLYAAGARIFIVVTLPDLGRTPILFHNTTYRPRGAVSADAARVQLADKLSALTAEHNAQLQRALAELADDMPGARIVVVDADRYLNVILDGRAADGSPSNFDYGFALASLEREIAGPSGTLHEQDRCYTGGFLGSSDAAKVCPHAARAVFWDTVHPSSYTHCWIAAFVQGEMVRAGLLTSALSSEQYRIACQSARPGLSPDDQRPTE